MRTQIDAIPALTGAPEQIGLAARMRAGHITTMLDMQANLTGHDAISSAISKLLHIALRQAQAAWWLRHAPDRHTGMLLSELAERLCEAGRMDGTMLPALQKEVHHLRDRAIGVFVHDAFEFVGRGNGDPPGVFHIAGHSDIRGIKR
jgi:hypothetical protein